jgi:TonB family protein
MSAIAHAVLIGTAAFLTARGTVPSVAPAAVALFFQPSRPEPARPPAPQAMASGVVRPAILSPVVAPVGMPPVDLRMPFDYERVLAFTRPGPAPAASADLASPSAIPLDAGAVERPVRLIGAQGAPHYPDALRVMGIEGRVLARFVVDTLGRVEGASVELIEVSHVLFADAVREALARARYIPAEAGGQHVRQLVVQPFLFSLAR